MAWCHCGKWSRRCRRPNVVDSERLDANAPRRGERALAQRVKHPQLLRNWPTGKMAAKGRLFSITFQVEAHGVFFRNYRSNCRDRSRNHVTRVPVFWKNTEGSQPALQFEAA